jgi:hypothetical protein
VVYGPNLAKPGAGNPPPCPTQLQPRPFEVAPGASVAVAQTVYGDEQFNGCSYLGSATISSTRPVVAVVTQEGPQGAGDYEALGADDLGGSIRLPLLQAYLEDAGSDQRISSAVTLANAGTAEASVRIAYEMDATRLGGQLRTCDTPPPDRVTIAPGASVILRQAIDEKLFSWCKWLGTMTVTPDDQDARVAALVTRRREPFVDQIAMFTGIYEDPSTIGGRPGG